MATPTNPAAAPAPVPVWMQALSLFLQTAPAVTLEIEQAVQDHWGKDHTQQIVKGAGVLAQVASTVQAVAAAQSGNAASPPPPPGP